MIDPTTVARAGPAAARIGLAVGAGAAFAGLALYAANALRAVPQATGAVRQEETASAAQGAGLARFTWQDAALEAMQGRQARCALEARAIDHDLRGPVGAMAVALELLDVANDAATRQEVVEVLQRQIARMTTLTQRVHELAQAMSE